jgi:hypothetical protein
MGTAHSPLGGRQYLAAALSIGRPQFGKRGLTSLPVLVPTRDRAGRQPRRSHLARCRNSSRARSSLIRSPTIGEREVPISGWGSVDTLVGSNRDGATASVNFSH